MTKWRPWSRPTVIEWIGILFLGSLLYSTVGGPIPICRPPRQEDLLKKLESARAGVLDEWGKLKGSVAREQFFATLPLDQNFYGHEQLHQVDGDGLLIGIICEDQIHSTADDKYYYLPLD